MRGLIAVPTSSRSSADVYSTFTTDTPQIYLKIDRDKAQTLGILPSDIFQALQASLGGYYVNDFNLFGRTWQVIIQGEAPTATMSRTSIGSTCATRRARWCRCARWRMPRCGSDPRPSSATTISAAHDQGYPAPGRISGEAIAAMERISKTTLPDRLCLRMVRHRAAGEGSRRADGIHSRARGSCLPICSWSASTRASRSR